MKISARDVQVSGGGWSQGARRNVRMEACVLGSEKFVDDNNWVNYGAVTIDAASLRGSDCKQELNKYVSDERLLSTHHASVA